MNQLLHTMIALTLLLTTWTVFLKRLYFGKQKVSYDFVGSSVVVVIYFLLYKMPK